MENLNPNHQNTLLHQPGHRIKCCQSIEMFTSVRVTVGFHIDISNVCDSTFTLQFYDPTSLSGDQEDSGEVRQQGCQASDRRFYISTFVCVTPLHILKGDLRVISSCVCGDQNRYFETKPDLSQTLIKWTLCLNPTRVKTKQSQHRMGNWSQWNKQIKVSYPLFAEMCIAKIHSGNRGGSRI